MYVFRLCLISLQIEGSKFLKNFKLNHTCRDLFEPADQDMPHAISVTPAEQEAIERVSGI